MNRRLITPAEVVGLAFQAHPQIDRESVTDAVILSAEQKFMRPVLGGLYDRLLAGELEELADGYVKPALAQYVRLLMLPSLAVSVGSLGVVRIKGGNLAPAAEEQLSALEKRARSDAGALMKRVLEHIESNRELYPEYDPADNILKRLSITSGIVL